MSQALGSYLRTLIIAEAGVNHNGDIKQALALVRMAAECGADYVKFQTFRAAALVSPAAPKAEYQRQSPGDQEGQLAMLQRLELSPSDHHLLIEECARHGIGFLSTAFDLPSLELLMNLGLDILKVPSGEITNAFLLERIAQSDHPVLLSTGMSTLEEIEAAIGLLTSQGRKRDAVTVLQCTTEYPTPFDEVNLRCLATLRQTFGTKVGLSDHTVGIAVPIAAVALGATVVEKHFTLDRTLPGPDHAASLEPAELAAMVRAIRQVERSLGAAHKEVGPSEAKNRVVARKSLHLTRDLEPGSVLEPEHLTAKRPGDGLSPMRWRALVGRRALRPLKTGEKLLETDLAPREGPDLPAAGHRTPLSVPTINGNEWSYVKESLDTGWVSSNGPFVTRFEKEISQWLGTKAAVATSCGTAALHLALLVAGVERNDEVLMPALTFIASANAVRYLDAWPTFLDVDPETWQLDVGRLESFLADQCAIQGGVITNKATGRRVTTVMPVHLLGHPCDMAPLLELSQRYGLRVVEDNAEALGSYYRNIPTGTQSLVSALSFNGNKIITTGGGGMVVTNDLALADRARYLSTQARECPVEYIHNEVGFNYRMTNLSAAVGVAQLEDLPARLERKRAIAHRYIAAFRAQAALDWQREAEWARSNWWLFTILVEEVVAGCSSRALMEHLREHGVEARPLFHPLDSLPPFQTCYSAQTPVAHRLHRQALCLPCSADLSEPQQDAVIAMVLSFVNGHTK